MIRIELSILSLLLAGYILFFVVLLLVVLRRADRRRRQVESSEALMPAVRDALVEYLAGNNDQARIREFVATNRAVVADAILTFHGAVAGSARDRLCDLALEMTLVHDWCQDTRSKDRVVRRTAYARLAFVCAYEPCRRVAGDLLLQALDDDDPEVRLPAARALVQSGTDEEIGQVFELAVCQNLLIRILLTEDLRRHAAVLCETVVPQALASEQPAIILASLQILVAWERALSLSNMHEFLEHRDRDIRIAALRLAPLIPFTSAIQQEILRALKDSDLEVSTVAAISAGRLRLQPAMPTLARCVRIAPAELARIAAGALAEMPPRGWETLEELGSGPNQSAAFIARDALQRARRKAGQ